ncbi:MAG: hypothetical protein QM817_12550 [Archangium sp.]
MTRQVALGAIVAFAATVLVLSVCQPTAEPPSVPAPPVVAQPAQVPAPTNETPIVGIADSVRPIRMRPPAAIRPELLQPKLRPELVQPVATDSGTP